MKNDVQDFFIKSYTKQTLGDIFSYRSRLTKRLLRTVLALSADLTQFDHVQKFAAKDEVWIACLIPVMQGYWRSDVPERKKKEVLYDLNNTMGNIIFNDVYIGQLKSDDDALDFHDEKNTEFNEKLRLRIDEYLRAIQAFVDHDHPTTMPNELIDALTQNLFAAQSSSNMVDAESDDRNALVFGEMMLASALMLSAFKNCMKL
jgi:hypothetical protein